MIPLRLGVFVIQKKFPETEQGIDSFHLSMGIICFCTRRGSLAKSLSRQVSCFIINIAPL